VFLFPDIFSIPIIILIAIPFIKIVEVFFSGKQKRVLVNVFAEQPRLFQKNDEGSQVNEAFTFR
jgi:hypothetical protein